MQFFNILAKTSYSDGIVVNEGLGRMCILHTSISEVQLPTGAKF